MTTIRTWADQSARRALGTWLLCAALPLQAIAQGSGATSWQLSWGGGVVSASRSLGSGRQITLPVPLIEARYKDLFFATDNPYEGVGIGADLPKGFKAYLAIGLDLDARDPSEDRRVKNLPKVGVAPALRTKVAYEGDRFFASGTLAERLTGEERRGASLNLESGANVLITDHWLGSVGLTARAVDHAWADNFLSVSAAQSGASGLSEHAARAGWTDTGAFAQAVFRINDRWTLFSRLQYARFISVAAASPIISHRSNPVGLLFFSRAF